MKTQEVISYTTEEQWLSERAKDLTSTEVATLFGCSPYMTAFELWHIKAGNVAPDFTPNERTKWGNRLESAIAYGIAEDLGLIVEPFKVYMRLPGLRMGSSFDFLVTGLAENYIGDESARDMFRKHGPGIMEIKNVDGLQFKRGWIDDGEHSEAPPHIELQVQHQMHIADMGWCIIAPLVGGNTPKVIIRERDKGIGAAIQAKASAFWASQETGNAPQPDYTQDGDTIAKLYATSNGETVDMSGDDRVAKLCAAYKQAGEEEAAAKERKDAAKAELMTMIGSAGKVLADGYSISANEVKPSQGTLITPEMVGQYIGGRKGYRGIRITQKKT